VNFEGRSSRAEYWWVQLFQIIVYVCIVVSFITLAGSDIYDSADDVSGPVWGIIGAGVLFMLANIIPSLSLSVRRFHDLDQTGWLVLLFFVANLFTSGLAGLAEMLWFIVRGTDGPNKYGPDPYGYDADVFG